MDNGRIPNLGYQGNRVAVKALHALRPHFVLPPHLLDHKLGIHDELHVIVTDPDSFSYGGDQTSVLGVVVGALPEEFGDLTDYAPVPGHDDGAG
ncbi:hypothetical protein SDC9_194236 [bioreactor metagenome]|uniref:Uncharacterized protein n=1 Tax=bioreactor metagenome TaxID=1076179 RepID=A0A645I5Q2_9ZZZZ